MPVKTWPDASMFQACAQRPDRFFLDPELRSATFEPDRKHGGAQVWSGARAKVLRANRATGGSVAVRLSNKEDLAASVRYGELDRYLAGNPVSTMVRTKWLAQGLRIGDGTFPLLKMEWVPGRTLASHLSDRLHKPGAGAELAALATAWRESCRALAKVGISHGDVHSGNTLVRANGQRSIELRLVDYDNVWFPGLQAPVKEAGHPAFQHPRRSELTAGPGLDAVPNTLTYLSLIALADDPALWRFHDGDDRLLFEKADLTDPSRAVWQAVRTGTGSAVTGLAELTVDWLQGPPGRFESLEQALAAAQPNGSHRAGGRLNTWRSPAPRTSPTAGSRKWPPRPGPGPATSPSPQLTWPPADPSAAAFAPAPASGRQTWQGLKKGAGAAGGAPPRLGQPPANQSARPGQERNHIPAIVVVAVLVAILVIALIVNG